MTTTLGELFQTFTRSAWRLEVRDHYDVPGEQAEIEAWERTGQAPAADPGWVDIIRAARARGAVLGRYRLVGHPVTRYTEWELAAYGPHAAAGEDIRVVDRAWLDASWDAAPDVWVFDETTAALMHYSPAGEFLGYDLVAAGPYVEALRLLAPLAVPLHDYHLGDVPQPRREGQAARMPASILAG